MTITAKFASSCGCGCGTKIPVGATIEWAKGQPARLPGHKAFGAAKSSTSRRSSGGARKDSYPQSMVGAHQIARRASGRSDSKYEVGGVVHAPKIKDAFAGGGDDGAWYTVLACTLRAPNEDNDDFDWRELAWVRAATADEAMTPAAKRAVGDAKVNALRDLQQAIRAGHDGVDPRLTKNEAGSGSKEIRIAGNVAGSIRAYVTDERAWLVDSMGDDYACWTAPLTDAMRTMIATLLPDTTIAGKTTPVEAQ